MSAPPQRTDGPTPPVALGSSGIVLKKPLGIGTMQWGRSWLDSKLNRGGNLSDEVCLQIFRELTERHGVEFFDTAEGYGGGSSEERLRDVVEWSNSRGKVTLATKFLPHLGRWSEWSLSRALRSSNKRLGVPCSDVYFIHTPVHPMPLEHWVAAAAKEANKGRIRALGLSNCNAEQVRRACAEAERHGQSIACNQIMYNLICYGSDEVKRTEAACRELGVTIVAYAPLAQGLLTKDLTPEKFSTIRVATMAGVTMEQMVPLRTKLAELSEKHERSMAQVCLNWAICHGAVPLVGCRSITQAQDSVGCLDWRLTDGEVAELDSCALSLSTLAKPKRRRAMFVVFISLLVLSYKITRAFEAAGAFVRGIWGHRSSATGPSSRKVD